MSKQSKMPRTDAAIHTGYLTSENGQRLYAGLQKWVPASVSEGLENDLRETEEIVRRHLEWVEKLKSSRMESQLSALEADAQRKDEALRELVACKGLKERIIELAAPNTPDSLELSTVNAEYTRRQPLAWEVARAALATTPPIAPKWAKLLLSQREHFAKRMAKAYESYDMLVAESASLLEGLDKRWMAKNKNLVEFVRARVDAIPKMLNRPNDTERLDYIESILNTGKVLDMWTRIGLPHQPATLREAIDAALSVGQQG